MARILLAIEDRDECELFAFALRFAGHAVSVTMDFREAISIARIAQPNLILLDAQLLDANGDRDSSSLPQELLELKIPVVYLLDEVKKLKYDPILESTGEFYIQKPITPDDFTKRVNDYLKRTAKRNR